MGGAPNPRADVFTIGVLAYQMVTGTLPFKARVAAGVDRADAADETARRRDQQFPTPRATRS